MLPFLHTLFGIAVLILNSAFLETKYKTDQMTDPQSYEHFSATDLGIQTI